MADADVWKDCLAWFQSCGVDLPEDEGTPQNVETFFCYLRNGVALCQLIHALDNGALDLNDNRLVCLKPSQMEVRLIPVEALVISIRYLQREIFCLESKNPKHQDLFKEMSLRVWYRKKRFI